MKFIVLLLTLLTVLSCTSMTSTATAQKQTLEELTDAVAVQTKSTEIIDKETKDIRKETKDPEIVASTDKIEDANEDLKDNIKVLSDVVDDRHILLAQIEDLQQNVTKLESKSSRLFDFMKMALYGMGALLISAGIFFGIKTSGEFFWLSIAGAALMVSAVAGQWIEANIQWLIGGGILATGIAIYRLWFMERRASESATKVAEQLKHELSGLTTTKATQVKIQEILDRMFGTYASTGTVECEQDTATKKIINRSRKKLNKAWAPTISK